jgi:hypothetical protein
VFFDSFLAQYPRRSCEAFWSSTIDMNPIRPNPAPQCPDWGVVREFYEPLFRDEVNAPVKE